MATSIWEIVEGWLKRNDQRYIALSHDGEGGRWYCLLEAEPEYDSVDGAGNTATEALQDAWNAMEGA
jgi:hypothetical protein